MLANKLKALREKKGMSQAELARVLDVAQQTVASWERENSSPNYDILLKIAAFFNVSTDELLGRDEPPKKSMVGGIIEMLAALSPQKQEQAKSYIAFLANEDKKA